jgi:nicotinamide riboside kinase
MSAPHSLGGAERRFAQAFADAWHALGPRVPFESPGQPVAPDASALRHWDGAAAGAPRRIALLGPESAGKTWLSERFAAELRVPFVPEYLRLWVDACGLPLDLLDAHAVARGQLASQRATAALAPRAYLCDTDLWMNALYARHYFGDCPAWILSEARGQPPALTVVLAPDAPWTPDPQRELPDEADRWQVFEQLCGMLKAEGCAFETAGGTWAERSRRVAALAQRVVDL